MQMCKSLGKKKLINRKEVGSMTEKQYERANKCLFPILMILYGIFLLLSVAIILGEGFNVSGVVQLIGSVLSIIISLNVYRKKGATREGAILLMMVGGLLYLLIMVVNGSNYVYSYAFPILCVSIIYLNVNYIKYGGCVAIGGILMHGIKLGIIGVFTGESFVIALIIAILIIFGAYKVCQLLTKFHDENIEAQVKSYDTMLIIADQLIDHFDTAKEMLEKAKDSIDTSKLSINEIAESTSSTAEAIQEQAIMCNEINQNTGVASEKAQYMINSSERTLENVSEGAKVIAGLKEQASNVEAASNDAAVYTKELSKRVDEVKGIINTILSISGQTNLLALNASIEAARAGEAGRGFAVVAEEIRKLSVQTQDATTQITDIINELNNEASRTVDSVDKSVTSIKQQSGLIDIAQDQFEAINQEINSLTTIINDIEGVIRGIITSTDTITEHISHLSATSEEIAASSEEGVRISDESSVKMNNLVDVIESTYELAKELKKYKN